ncbi:extracellular solute-binding protein [Caviibacter abscessus]|uniref:extracellular solute-binding protein n=1 Tax=Caviibacter abscessus TaxID=1766719 RepID=UPI00082C2D2B|nr:extracellular solute-binding protein [Caviibacter abscessus]
MKKVLLVGLFSVLAVIGCSNKLGANSERETTIFAMHLGKALDPELPVYKKAAEKTKIKLVNVASKNQTDEVQAFNLMLSSGKLPDIIAYELTADLENLGIQGGLIPLEKLIDKYAPNIKKFFEENPRYKKDAVAVDGHIYMIPNYYDYYNLRASQGNYIRKDWLKKLNLEEPKTVEDLYNVLKAFREKDPNGNGKKDEVPIFFRANNVRKVLMPLTDLFKAKVTWYDKNGVPAYGPAQEEYKDAMIQLAKWYKEGLIDKEVFTRGMTSRDYMLSNNLGGYTNDWFASTGAYNGKLADKIPGFDFSVILPLVYKGNNKTTFSRSTHLGGWGISSSAKNPEELIKYFDFWFSEEGRRLWNYGIEGEDYTLVDGKPIFTDKILKDSEGRNPLSVLYTIGAQFRLGMFQDANYEKQWASKEALSAMNLYMESNVIEDLFPELKYTQEESKELLKIEAQMRAYAEEMSQKWILGTSSVEKDWDSYIKRLNELGLGRANQIMKTAYDRFNK